MCSPTGRSSGIRRCAASLLHADRVVPSLDAITPDHFQKVNRPHPNLDLSLILEGLLAFRREYRGQFHLEVMLVAQVNDQDEHLRR